jgi:hypothetical protein
MNGPVISFSLAPKKGTKAVEISNAPVAPGVTMPAPLPVLKLDRIQQMPAFNTQS